MSGNKQLKRVFWNQDEKRLRAFWRLGIHTGLLFVLTSLFTVGLMLIAVIVDVATGTSLQEVVAGTGPIAIMEAPWVMMVIAPLATLLGVLSATFLSGRWFDRRNFSDFGLSCNKEWRLDFAFGLGLGAVLMGLIFMVGWLTGSIRVTGFFQVFNQDLSFALGILQALVFFIFVGFYEELLSRGYHLVNLAEGFNHTLIGGRWALLLAYLVSALVFGILHLGNPNANWVSVVNIVMAGIFLGLGMVLTGSLAIPIGLHITWNFFQGNVFGFAVSGIRTGATLIATETVSNSWLVGGEFGPESGLISIAAMVLGGYVTILWLKRKGQLRLVTDLAEFTPKKGSSKT